MLDGRNNRFLFPWEQMFFLMQTIFIVLPFNMAAVQNLYTLHKERLWFCFAELIQQDLDFVKIHWNTHYIRQSRRDAVPGKPDELYFFPEHFGASDFLQPVSPEKLEEARMKCKTTD